MDLIEVIGLIVLLLAFVLPAIRRLVGKPSDPEARRKAEEEYYRLLNGEEEEEEPPSQEYVVEEEEVLPEPPPPKQKELSTVESREFESSIEEDRHLAQIEDRYLTSDIADRVNASADYAAVDEGSTELQERFAKASTPREMILMHEILSLPVSERSEYPTY